MKAHLIVAHRCVGEHGLYQVNVLCGALFLCAVNGMCFISVSIAFRTYITVWGLCDGLQIYSTLLPALSLEGVIFVKIVEGSFTSAHFRAFISCLLDFMQPFLASNSVIIMDNARIHKDPDMIDMVYAQCVGQYSLFYSNVLYLPFRGMQVMFLPPYSPDYNPIELAFSVIKAFVYCAGILQCEDVDQGFDDTYVYLHILDTTFSVTPDNALGSFHHCGYI